MTSVTRRSLAVGLAGTAAAALAMGLDASRAGRAASQAWAPFVLVAGLLLIGAAADADELFEAIAARLARLPVGTTGLLLAGYALVAVVTALLNLDTAAVFVTPLLVRAARQRRLDPAPFLYGALFMLNAASLFLPGSNLTNLLVLRATHASGGAFAADLLPAALAAPLITAAGLLVLHRRRLAGTAPAEPAGTPAPPAEPPPLRFGVGLLASAGAASAVVTLGNPALPVLGVGLLAAAVQVGRGRLTVAGALGAVDAPFIAGLLALSVALGTLARSWGWPAHLMRREGTWATAGIGALAAVLVNNLPAAVLLSATSPSHPRALLLGLNIGPNLAVSGSLSAALWWRAATTAGVRPSLAEVSREGLVLGPLALAGGLLALRLLAPGAGL